MEKKNSITDISTFVLINGLLAYLLFIRTSDCLLPRLPCLSQALNILLLYLIHILCCHKTHSNG